ncbi:MAG TPA: phenylalanine--tRNA ligase subunit beta, partial [Gammaproteobacteria bacterium]|nr:phenylalanine--tRNA ligase subunit beta [Gammaproteobacteria bacterium]
MKISTDWLREWVPVEVSTDVLAERLTMAGLEVEGIAPAAAEFSGVIVAEIIDCEQHPDADKLRVCRVSTGKEALQIVCGAPNARAGLKAPLAMIGAALPGGLAIRRSKLRGVESHGMLCSARELGLSEDAAGLMELPADAPVGTDLRAWLGLDDQIIEVDLTPNRSDCLSMRGVAREVGALFDLAVGEAPTTETAATISDQPAIRLEAPASCPRYLGRIVRGVDVGAASPMWLIERLRRAGIRSLGPVVDITNYVMLELGQPMHAFDLAKIDRGIVVRQARNGETLELLNGQTVTLRDDTLVIADEARPLALAGVMGGAASAVGDDTADILLESAFFAPAALAGRARQYGLHTDSSHRFERGVDYALPRQAMERATQLILEIAGGQAGPVVEALEPAALPAAPEILLRAARISRLLGVDIPAAEVEGILRRLGLGVEPVAEGWRVRIPSFRFDLAIEVDLIEELARVWGYERIPARRPVQPATMSPEPESRVARRRLRDLLVDRGYQEAITYSFVEPKLQQLLDPEQPPLALANPISSDLSVMRTNLWPGLIGATLYNQNRQQGQVRLFEIGLRFRGELDSLVQERMIAGVATGLRLPEQWGSADTAVDFYDVKGDVEAMLALTGEPGRFRFEVARHPALHPGQSAQVWRDEQPIGWLGALHPQLEKSLDLDGRTFVFELLLDAVTAARTPAFAPLSRFPSIRRDLAVILADDTPAEAVLQEVRQAAGELLREVFAFDVYRGKGIPEGRKSLAIGLILQDSSRTLTDEDVD